MKCCRMSEFHAQLYVCDAVVVPVKAPVVYKGIFGLYLDVLVYKEVQSCLILCPTVCPRGRAAVKIIACLDSEFSFDHGSDAESVEAVSLVALGIVYCGVVFVFVILVCRLESIAGAVYIFRAYLPVGLPVFGTERIAVLAQADRSVTLNGVSVFCFESCALACV